LAKVAVRGVDLEPIDRLEEKVKLLVGVIDRLRADQARAADENTRLNRELDGLRDEHVEAAELQVGAQMLFEILSLVALARRRRG